MWEVIVGNAVKSNGEKMRTTITEQQKKNKIKFTNLEKIKQIYH